MKISFRNKALYQWLTLLQGGTAKQGRRAQRESEDTIALAAQESTMSQQSQQSTVSHRKRSPKIMNPEVSWIATSLWMSIHKSVLMLVASMTGFWFIQYVSRISIASKLLSQCHSLNYLINFDCNSKSSIYSLKSML